MAMVNRILVIVASLLAVIAVILSFVLFQRRDAFRDRADLAADTVAKITVALDKNSGSPTSAVTFTAADPVSKKSQGTLSWDTFKKSKTDYTNSLAEAVKLAQKVQEQRDFLAQQLADTAGQIGAADEVQVADLRNTAKCKVAAGQVTSLAAAVKARDEAMINTLVTAGKTMGQDMKNTAFTERQQVVGPDGGTAKGEFNHAIPLTEFGSKASGLVARSNDYADTLVQIIEKINAFKNWTADKALIKDEKEYAKATTAMRNDSEDINSRIKQLDIVQAQLSERIIALKAAEEDRDTTKKELTSIKQILKSANEELEKFANGGKVAPANATKLRPDLTGKVKEVSEKYNFVVLDLGSAEVVEKTEFLVVRNSKYIGRLQVSKVMNSVSIAEVLPNAPTVQIKVDDTVILPNAEVVK